jgi:hypothetical protein
MERFIEQRLGFAQRYHSQKIGRRATLCMSFVAASPYRRTPSLERQAISDSVKPISDRLLTTQPVRLANQQQKRGLEHILDISRLRQQTLADAQDHRPMPAQQRGKCALVSLSRKTLQQLSIRQALRGLTLRQFTDMLQEKGCRARHDPSPRWG